MGNMFIHENMRSIIELKILGQIAILLMYQTKTDDDLFDLSGDANSK